MSTILTILHVLVCLFLMLTVLLQAGKGGGMGAAFGGGSSSGTVFGGSGAGNFLKKLTVGAAVVFVFTSMTLAYLASSSGSDSLKSYSAEMRHNAELKKKQHEAATKENGAAVAPGEAANEGLTDETPGGEVEGAEPTAVPAATPPEAAAPAPARPVTPAPAESPPSP
jgi:preprotein translocase subunit SecG